MEDEDRERSEEEGEKEGKEDRSETQRRFWQFTDLTVIFSNKPVCFGNVKLQAFSPLSGSGPVRQQ